jgi:hypothetical protein
MSIASVIGSAPNVSTGLLRQLAGASGSNTAFMPIAFGITTLTEALGGLLLGLR